MARIRTIKPEFFKHWKLYNAEQETGLPLRVAFSGLWTICDREGRFRWIPQQIKIEVLPYDDIEFSRVLDALWTRGFLEKYVSDGEEFGVVPGFTEHQVINNREKESTLPEPIEFIEKETGDQRVDDACSTPLCSALAERKGKEGKGREQDISSSGDDVMEAVELYNQTAEKIGLSKAQKITDTRKRHLRKRLKDCGGLDGWRYAMKMLADSPHCRGENDRGWTADLDFVLRESKFVKLMEGAYSRSDKPATGQSSVMQAFDDMGPLQ